MDQRESQRQASQIEALLQEVAAFPDPHLRAKTEELLQALLGMYGTCLARILEITAQAEASGQTLIEAFAQEELVGSLLLLHGLHPIELETRLLQAVEKIRASKQARGTTIELVQLEEGVAHLRLTGESHGCASSAGGLRASIEEAIYSAAPDLVGLEIEEVARQASKPVKFIPRRKANTPAPPNGQPGAGGGLPHLSSVR